MMREPLLSELEQPLAAELRGADCRVRGVTTDSRQVDPGDLFVALRGERFDGHAYLEQARGAGAVAALVCADAVAETGGALPLLQVADTQRALGLLGAWNRDQFTGPVVAITGSNGKTTAKNLLASVLSQRGPTLATEGNFNNEIGLPLTLLRLARGDRFAVVEMGAAGIGHIAWLCELGRPTVAVLLNAMAAHLEGFGSIDNVARAKGEIFDRLGPHGTAVINADQPHAALWRARAGSARIIDFALDAPAAVSARDIDDRGIAGTAFTAVTPAGELPVVLQLPGRHNVANALAAICAGLACGLEPAEIGAGLAAVAPAPGRLAVRAAAGGVTLIDDCYNANPASVQVALELLADRPPRRTAILGVMLELGDTSERMHRAVGERARELGLEALWGLGPALAPAVEAFGDGGRMFADHDELLAALASGIRRGDTVLVKGSRGARMEIIAQALMGGSHGEDP